MTKLPIAFILIFAVACAPSKKSDAVDEQGLCTDVAINSYNDTRMKIIKAADTGKLEDYQVAESACQNFRQLMEGKSCKATASNSGGDQNVNVDSHKQNCERVNAMIAAYTSMNKTENKVAEPDENKKENKKPAKKTPQKRSE